MGPRFLALLPLGWLLAAPALLRASEEGDALLPGQLRERAITAQEAHVYRVEVAESPLLVTVEQRSVNLVVEARRADEAPVTVDSGLNRWGTEVLLLEPAGTYRIEIRPRDRSEGQGRYAVRSETQPASAAEGAERRAGLAAMSRAGREAFAGTPEAQRQAVASYREALAAWRSLGDRRWEAEALYDVAVLEHDLNELQPAIEDHARSMEIWRELGEPRREAAALYGIGIVQVDLEKSDEARETLQGARALWQLLGERLAAARSHMDLCYLDHRGGALPAALACYQESLAALRELGARGDEARILNGLGGVHDILGAPGAALDAYTQALDLRRAIGDRAGEAQSLNNIAVIHRLLGEWQEALRLYDQAREILEPLGVVEMEAPLLNNMGYAYRTLGEPQRALAFFERALDLRKKTGDRRGEIISRNNLGVTRRILGDPQGALEAHRHALDLATALGDRRQIAISHLRLGEGRLEQGDPAGALRDLDKAITFLRETGDRQEVEVLHLQGQALARAGRPQEAIALLQKVLARRQILRDRAGEVETLRALAMAERTLGLRKEARAHADATVAKVEELRNGFVSPGLRAAFLATQRRAYSLRIDLDMDLHAADPKGGHDRAALEISEQARARSLLDILHSGTAARAGSAVPAALLDRRKSLRYLVSVKADQQLRKREAGDAKADAALTQEIDALLAELDGVEAEIHQHDPQYAALRKPQPLGVDGISALLDPGTLLLEYSLGEERSYLWAVGGGKLQTFVLPGEREIEALARRSLEELSTVVSGAGSTEEAAESLSRILLRPIWKEAAHFQRLVVVPDAALHVLPFAGLPVPEPGKDWDTPGGIHKHLLEHHEVVYVPSATTLALQRQRLESRRPAAKWAAVLADPVFDAGDPRVEQPSGTGRPKAGGLLPGFERLPYSRQEADSIAGLAPAGQVWTALGFAASRETVLSGELALYRFVHLATHGVADDRNPELSGLVLSLVDGAGRPREGFLGLSDIYELDLGADLVVLSGCQTALGKEVRGEGLMGLTRGFLYAGVPRVVASLWRVQDRTTDELMSRFYKSLWKDGLRPAAALREAQRSLRSSNPRYRNPYSWAGFVLQGDWR